MLSKIQNYIKDNTGILIRLDDIAENMNWNLMKKLELLFEKYGIKPVLGVIPNNKDSQLLHYQRKNDFWDQVRTWRNKGSSQSKKIKSKTRRSQSSSESSSWRRSQQDRDQR